MDRGWVRVERRVFDDEWLCDEPFTKLQAWLDLIQMAAHKPTTLRTKAGVVELETGQLTASVRFLAERWQWSKSRVSRFLGLLRDFDRISYVSGTAQLVVTVCNYEQYQGSTAPKRDSKRDSSGTAAGQNTTTKPLNHSSPSEKKNKGADAPSFEVFWKDALDTYRQLGAPPGNKQEALNAWALMSANDREDAHLLLPCLIEEIQEERKEFQTRKPKHVCRWLKFGLWKAHRHRIGITNEQEVPEAGGQRPDRAPDHQPSSEGGVPAGDGGDEPLELRREVGCVLRTSQADVADAGVQPGSGSAGDAGMGELPFADSPSGQRHGSVVDRGAVPGWHGGALVSAVRDATAPPVPDDWNSGRRRGGHAVH